MSMEGARRYRSHIELRDKNNAHTQLILQVGRNKRVLEVGPATGYISEALSSRGCRVTAVEKDPEAAKIAEAFCERMLVGDIERLDIASELEGETFDVIMFGDVLEHLVEPQIVLAKIAPLLAPGGYVLASVPNIAHGSVRLALLNGTFSYTDWGLLDRTHLRFFTHDTLASLFRGAGYAVRKWTRVKVDPFATELQLSEAEFPSEVIGSLRDDEEALTYQFVVRGYLVKTAARAKPAVNGGRAPVLEALWNMHGAIRSRDEELGRQAAALAKATAALQKRERLLQDKEAALQQLSANLASIEQSTGYRFLRNYRRVVRRVFPPGSRRALPYRAFRRSVRGVLDGASKLRSLSQGAPGTQHRPGAVGFLLTVPELILGSSKNSAHAAIAEAKRWFAANAKAVTVVIPTYADYELTAQCVNSIRKLSSSKHLDIVVVDDGSDRDIRETLRQQLDPSVKLVLKDKNEGFARTCNAGLALVKRGDVVLLNNDTIVHDGWIEALQYEAHREQSTGIVGAKLLYPDGTIQWAGTHRNPGAPDWFDHRFRFKPSDYLPANVPGDVLSATGACMYIKRNVINKIGLFDPEFEMAFEDVDYSLRAWNAGFRVRYVPEAVVTHMESKTRGMVQGPREIRSQQLFWRKWSKFFDARKVATDDGRLRVIYVMQDTGVAGGHRVIYEHLNGLAAAGHDVALYALAPAPKWFSLKVPVKSFKSYRELEADLARQEAIKVATWWETAASVWRCSVTRGIPVFLVQDVETSYYGARDGLAMLGQVLASYRSEFRYIAGSQWIGEELAKLGLSATVITPAIDRRVFREQNVARERDLILAVGRSHPLKNLDFTLRAWRKVRDRCRLMLYGIEPNLANEQGIEYIYRPSDEQIVELYARATVFVQTSRHEGFCLTALEAMACGTPVVCTDADSNMEFCVDGENCLLVEHDNVLQLVHALQRVLNDDTLRNQLSEAGLKTAANYNWEARVLQLERLYTGLAGLDREIDPEGEPEAGALAGATTGTNA